ncbi:ATP-binding protein [Halorarius litoreus]|uniref:ATP-binding protein n=1 Tax=Halorarius litoreus TaxID=2962676 RepID=UPI0020CBCE4A|nr:ATP-binding protein [Halorarius litoreus]
MSLGPTVLHVLHVGCDPAPVVNLQAYDASSPRFLASVAPDADVAVTQLTRGTVDCVVCDAGALDADGWAFLHRVADLARDLPVVLTTSADDIPAHLYDATVPSGDTTRLASVVTELVRTDDPGPPAGETAVALLDRADEYVAHVARDGTVRMVGASTAERLGLARDAVVGRQLDDLLDPTTAGELLSIGRSVLDAETGREFSDELGGRHYHAVFEPVGPDCFEVIVRDVTAARRTERAFHEERAFLETVVDSLTDVFFVLDLDGRLVRWNDRLEAVTGRDETSLRGADPLEFVADADVPEARRQLDAVVDGGEVTAELELVDGNGETVPFEFTASLVTGDDGTPRYVCAVGRDISARRATQADLDDAIAELERSNAELEQFAYVASHDLKEPLRMVSSYLQLLERRHADDLDEEASEFIEFAVDGAYRLQEMIDDLLEYSRVGRSDRALELVDCNAVLETVRRNLAVAIEDSGATVEVGDLPTVQGDRSQLVELFQNLVSNAIKYTESGERPHVTVTADAADDRWLFVVEDEGMGISADRVDRVFDLFYRSEIQDSTGIGLALVQKIVERHGGEVWVESTPGEGSSFFVALPRE